MWSVSGIGKTGGFIKNIDNFDWVEVPYDSRQCFTRLPLTLILSL